MFHPGYETTFEFWHLPYTAYILWIAGLLLFPLMANMARDGLHIGSMMEHWLGRCVIVWSGFSLFALVTAFPLLWMVPLVLPSLGAPLSATVIAICYALFAAYLGGRLLINTRPEVL